ncbi:hypothetical protein CFELI_02010 [Corynebacterium felinum]|uniref:Uncharacterized protein n=1 Tax=Corynebacterium felinum TaxID=131318 RepID=A0ABU2B7U2_9CORY|nr:hypothetical protein [Corynebacterium felinum]WJY94044.1 hypothetical protein CFELI_02010 [Corynebacterium felinum]
MEGVLFLCQQHVRIDAGALCFIVALAGRFDGAHETIH